MRDNDDAEVLLTESNELYHADCGQTVAVEDGRWRCADCEMEGAAPEVHPDGWLRDSDGAWVRAVGDGTVSIELFDDELKDWPPFVELRAERDAALAEVARLREGIERHRSVRYGLAGVVANGDPIPADRDLWALLDTEDGGS